MEPHAPFTQHIITKFMIMATLMLCDVNVGIPVAAYSVYDEQQFAMEPQDQVAVVGARVILPCRVINKQGVLQWTKDDFGLGTRRKLVGFERYSMIGSDEEGDYSLQIYPVSLEDNAEFQCQVSPAPNGSPGVRSRYATLTVLVSPDAPVIIQGDVLMTTEDRDIDIECVSANGKPAAEITWIDGFGNVLTQGIDYSTEMVADRKRITAKSVLKLKATKDVHNKTIICQAQNTVDVEYRTAQVRIEVKYAPKVIVSIVDGALDTGRIPEGNIVSLLCQADANPSDINYRWYINDEQIDGQTSHTVTLFNVTRDYQNSLVKCVVQNSVGISLDTESLDVIYQPSFVRRPQNLEADDQELVTLHCEVDANPVPEIVWVFDPIDRINLHPRVVGTTTDLEVTASSDSAGRYFCKAHSPGFPELRAEATVSLKGPPKIISPNEQFPNSMTIGGLLASSPLSGDNPRRSTSSDGSSTNAFEIECVAISIPKAEHVSWAFNGKLIDFDADEGFTLRESYLPDGVKSTLTIEENHVDYFGKYSCIVINSYGSDTLEIFFTEPKKFSAVIAIAGSVLIFIIIISGAAMIVFCVRMNKAVQLPPADIIPKESVTNIKGRAANRKPQLATKLEMPTEHQNEYQESNSGSYSTTTTLSINKTDLIAGSRVASLSIPVTTRYSANYNADNLSIQTNQSLTGGSSYVDYARDYYSPTIQNANNCLLQQMQRETPTYV